jgi:hypothetical protein
MIEQMRIVLHQSLAPAENSIRLLWVEVHWPTTLSSMIIANCSLDTKQLKLDL